MADVHHQVSDDPGVVMEIEIMHLPNGTVGGGDGVAMQCFQAS
jgi:hypothetical protein